MTQILQNPVDYSGELIAYAGNAIKAMTAFREARALEPTIRAMPREWVKDVEAAIRARYSLKLWYLIEAVKAHALVNYERDGWDYVVETMDSDDIARLLKHDMWTVKQAIRIIRDDVKAMDDMRSEVSATEF